MKKAADLDVGKKLKSARLERKLSLEMVSKELCITKGTLKNLEDNNNRLKRDVYVIGHIRAYAEFLGLNADEIVAEFKEISTPAPSNSERSFLMPMPTESVPKSRILLGSAALALVIGFGVHYFSGLETTAPIAEAEPEVTEQMIADFDAERGAPQEKKKTVTQRESVQFQPETPQPQAKTEQPRVTPTEVTTAVAEPEPIEAIQQEPPVVALEEIITEAQNEAKAEQESFPQETIVKAEVAQVVEPEDPAEEDSSSFFSTDLLAKAVSIFKPKPQTETKMVVAPNPIPKPTIKTAQPVEPAKPTVAEAQKATKQEILMEIVEDSWVEVRNLTGDVVVSRVFHPGDLQIFTLEDDLILHTGNAGGVMLTIDGHTTPPLGKSGQVIDHLSLRPEKLLARYPQNQ